MTPSRAAAGDWEQAGHYDKPSMPWEMVYGQVDTPGGIRMRYEPDVIVIA